MGVVPDPARSPAATTDVARRVEKLYTAHFRLVRSVCRSLLRDRNEAEDAVQQTFLSAQRALANGSSPREPAAWLATIARNECLARVRERMREPLPLDAEPTDVGADAHSAAVSRYEVATLREALADLPRAQREAILLREMRGLSYDEVAHSLSVTTGAVESLIFRARRTLQVRLGEALSALSPVAFLTRLLAAGGGDVAAPVVKVAAVGVGAALLAGGAALDPQVLGLGHAATKTTHAAPPKHVHATPPTAFDPRTPVVFSPVPVTAHQPARDVSLTEKRSSDTADTSRPEASSSDTSSSDTSSSDKPNSDGSSAERETIARVVPPASSTPATTPAPKPAASEPGDGTGD